MSKFLSRILRHEPEAIGLTLDAQGWAEIDLLIAKSRAHGAELSRDIIAEVVTTDAKQRFALSADGLRIRASQGHSVAIDLDYPPAPPPEILFHGTVGSVLPSVRVEGLRKMARHHVHLSADAHTARVVGVRRGRPMVLRVAAGTMRQEGHVLHLSANGVWLTDHVPPAFIEFPET